MTQTGGLNLQLPEFNASTMRWSIYARRLKNYIAADQIVNEEVKCGVLLTVIGDSVVQTLVSLVAFAQPEEQTLEQLLDILNKHYGDPQKPSQASALLEFRRCTQTEGQSLEVYVAELRRIAEDCAFTTQLEDQLCDQLIAGVKYDSTRKEILKLPDAARTFDRCYKTAQKCEKLYRDLK